MPRSPNAQIAVDLYFQLAQAHGLCAANAWHGIARLPLTTNVRMPGIGWQPFYNVAVYRETDDFRPRANGAPNTVLQRAEVPTQYLAEQPGAPRAGIDRHTGVYWRQAGIATLQPHNLIGHAFRPLIVAILQRFGDPGITYEEEADPHAEFPGFHSATRSPDAKLDIVARRNSHLAAPLSAQWRSRHDRVDLVDEALASAPPAPRQNHNCRPYAVIGEFAPDRLHKVLKNCPPAMPHAALDASVHFAPDLIWYGLPENGRTTCLKNLECLIQQANAWQLG
jgi:hypothetical protein